QGFVIDFAPVTPDGIVDTAGLVRLLRDDTILVSVMLANNETGAIQPLRELADILRPRGVLFHTDAVQAVGKIVVDVNGLGLDLLSLSAHKIYGPKGVGALYVRKGTRIEPIIHGGHHEHGLRGGTESVPLVVGLASALELASAERETEMPRLAALRATLEKGILADVGGAVVNALKAPRLPQISSISFDGVNGETLLLNLDANGIAVSTGAACSSGAEDPSHVLTAMGLPRNLALAGVRFSLGKWTTDEDIARTVKTVVACVEKLRRT
ncbi:MAG: cysteine desulfurase family protein, partial [Planctomycetota bacterium]|nr:cysteine desulfurase family protein [Planctomycetota bacterium]